MENVKSLTTTEQPKTVLQLFQAKEKQLAVCLPKGMSVQKLIREAMTAIHRNPTLATCTRESLVFSLFDAAQLGLYPSSILGTAHLVPFWSSKAKAFEAKLIPGYKGLIELARRSGKVADIYAQLVYENEEMIVEYGLDRKLIHKPLPPSARGEKVVGAYAVAKLVNASDPAWIWLWYDEIDKLAQTQIKKTKGNTQWNDPDNWPEMAKKTAIRRLAKYLSLSPEFDSAAALDEDPEQRVDLNPVGSRPVDDQAIPTTSEPVQETNQNPDGYYPPEQGPESAEPKSKNEPPFEPLTITTIGSSSVEFKKLIGANGIDVKTAIKIYNDNKGNMAAITEAVKSGKAGK